MQLVHVFIQKFLKVLNLPLGEQVARHFGLVHSDEHDSLQFGHFFVVLVIHLDLFLSFTVLDIVFQSVFVLVL